MKRIIILNSFVGVTFVTFLAYGDSSRDFYYPDPAISVENMRQTVHYLSAMSPPRNYMHSESLKKAANYIFQGFKNHGLTPERQKFEVLGNTYENIIASAGPKEGIRMIVGAHYDVCGEQPGADDNASAVAGLLEMARFAKLHESKLPHRVDFVAYALEEPPFFGTTNMGSYVHAKFLHENNIRVRGMICLEMIGFFTNKKRSQRYPLSLMRLFYPSKGDFIGVVGNFGSASLLKQLSHHLKSASIKVETLKAPSFLTGVGYSDHLNYWKFGYEAVMVTDTAFYRNPNYHAHSDTIETLDFGKMQEVVKGICWALVNIK